MSIDFFALGTFQLFELKPNAHSAVTTSPPCNNTDNIMLTLVLLRRWFWDCSKWWSWSDLRTQLSLGAWVWTQFHPPPLQWLPCHCWYTRIASKNAVQRKWSSRRAQLHDTLNGGWSGPKKFHDASFCARQWQGRFRNDPSLWCIKITSTQHSTRYNRHIVLSAKIGFEWNWNAENKVCRKGSWQNVLNAYYNWKECAVSFSKDEFFWCHIWMKWAWQRMDEKMIFRPQH